MIIDCHTHMWRYPDHLSQQIYDEQAAVARRTGQGMNPDLTVEPEAHWAAMAPVDRAVVFGLRAKASGYDVPNDYVAAYVKQHPEKLIGFAGIDPNEPDPVGEIDRCVSELGMRGLKLSPVYSHFDPWDLKVYPIYERAQSLKLPTLWHSAGTLLSQGSLDYASPILLDRVAREFPDLVIILAHLGKPFYRETAVMVRKHANVYADVSSVLYHPFEFYQTLLMFHEWRVMHKLLLGSDYPWMTPQGQIDALYRANEMTDKTNMPRIPEQELQSIVEENAQSALKHIL